MGKATTPSYILELELEVNPHERKLLRKKLEIGRNIYNACLGEALKRHHMIQADKEYRELLKERASKERTKRLKEIRLAYGFSEYQLHAWSANCKRHFDGQLGINEVQKLATRAFRAVEKLHYHEANKVTFKKKDESVSIEGKNNSTGLRRKGRMIEWGRKLHLSIRVKKNDDYAENALQAKTKFVRILKREIRGKERFFVQLVQEGYPPKKDRKAGAGTAGLDIGPSTIAIVSKEYVKLQELAPGIIADTRKLRRMERAMDRSKRAINPDNFDKNGVVKKGCKWVYSNRYRKLKIKRKELHRKIAAKRKQSHEMLANEILAHCNDIRVETMRFQGLQKQAKKTTRNQKNGKINKKKRFGKSIGNHAPSMFLSILEKKLMYEGEILKKVDTFALKASQFNHVTGEYQKKPLSERWNDIGGIPVQRDLYSAFLIGNTKEDLCNVDMEQCDRNWEEFVKLHDEEVKGIRSSGNKVLKWYVA